MCYHSGSEWSKDDERELHISHSSRTGDSPSDSLKSCLRHSLGGVLLLYRDSVGVFYSAIRLGCPSVCLSVSIYIHIHGGSPRELVVIELT